MRRNNSFRVAVTYIGAIIGAGFASGQEILHFFVTYGNRGLMGVLLSGLLFSFLGVIIIYISSKLNCNSYKELFYTIGGNKIGFLADITLTLFLLGSLIVMLAGSKEICNELFNYKVNIGLIVTLLIVIWTNYYGLEGIMSLNFILIPILVIITIIITGNLITAFHLDQIENYFNLDWIISSLIYTGYNFVLSMTVLIPLTEGIKKSDLFSGIFLGGIMLGFLAFLIAYTLNQFYPQVSNSQIPLLEIIFNYQPKLYYVYSITLWLAMLTTATCNLYALTKRLTLSISLSEKKIILMIVLFILPFIKLPFSSLVEFIYPQIGKLSLGLFLLLFINYFMKFIIRS
ncbi:putative membrane protein YkvI [Orenia marismortui]|uniref:Putative membrane protein YkvI n=1 Tax=Orenia marismortui TaxID=46469 RepID=A0A4R8GYX0_9FIRM|nr:putative membrane protein YkvI [Orenia marismortui]